MTARTRSSLTGGVNDQIEHFLFTSHVTLIPLQSQDINSGFGLIFYTSSGK